MRPYIVTAFMTVAVACLYCWANNILLWLEIKRWVIAALWGSGWSGGSQLLGSLPAIGPIWFLLALFWACLIYSVICKKVDGINKAIVVIGVFVFGMVSSKIITLPWSIQSGCCAILYLYVGNLIRKYDVFNIQLSIISKVILSGIVIYCVLSGGGISMNAGIFRYGLLSVIASLACCVALILILKKSRWSGGWTGRNTLSLMCGNQLVDSLNYFYHAGSCFSNITKYSILNLGAELITCLVLTYLFGYFFYKSRLITH